MPFRKQFKSNEEYNAWFREYREKNREKIRAYNREYNKRHRKIHGYHNEETWKINNPHKIEAQKFVKRALRLKRIKKLPCEICKNKNSFAHHNNYDKPLEIIWLCHKHHSWIHLNFNEAGLKTKRKQTTIEFLKMLDEWKK